MTARAQQVNEDAKRQMVGTKCSHRFFGSPAENRICCDLLLQHRIPADPTSNGGDC
jgi:hypothetical protein